MCSPGEFPNDFTQRMIEKYSEKVNDDGFFLGVADAFLFAVKQGKSLAIAVSLIGPWRFSVPEIICAGFFLKTSRSNGEKVTTWIPRVLILGA